MKKVVIIMLMELLIEREVRYKDKIDHIMPLIMEQKERAAPFQPFSDRK